MHQVGFYYIGKKAYIHICFILNGHRLYFPGIKLLGRDVKRSPPFSAKVKTEWSYYNFTPIYRHSTNKGNFNLLFSGLIIYALNEKTTFEPVSLAFYYTVRVHHSLLLTLFPFFSPMVYLLSTK